MSLYKRAIADAGDASVLSDLSFIFQRGLDGVNSEPSRAVQVLSRAVEEGYRNFISHLARLLTTGADGVSVDRVRAVERYTRVIEKRRRHPPYSIRH